MTTRDLASTVCFAIAIVHTFSAGRVRRFAGRFPRGTTGRRLLHLLGEVEVAFGAWAGVFLLHLIFNEGPAAGLTFVERLSFTEPVFVFVVMTVCATRPVLSFVSAVIALAARALPVRRPVALYATTMTLGPLLGSFVTEPAAMTVTALILLDRFFSGAVSERLKYASLGLLFVNVSIGGTLTPYAAPPVLMVARAWDWDLAFMLAHFGWKAVLACGLSTSAVVGLFYRELANLPFAPVPPRERRLPRWVTALHLAVLIAVVMASHHLVLLAGLFALVLGLVAVTKPHQTRLKLREGLLVAFFLAGLIVLGPGQRWWLEPAITHLGARALYFGAIALTAVSDNAALTYLGAQVPDLSVNVRYVLVAGAVVGGGLTVVANAPNPAGYGILNPAFGPAGITPWRLFRAAWLPTVVAGLCFLL